MEIETIFLELSKDDIFMRNMYYFWDVGFLKH